MQQMLVDALTGDQVILAPARALRPDTFRVPAQPVASTAACPFCDGKEDETPPEVARVGTGAPDSPGWDVRVVPNKYPIVGDGVPGAHEVVIFSPTHAGDLAQIPAPAAIEVLGMLRDRAAFHLAAGFVYAQPFVNQGKAAGASIAHPHAQLVALDTVPPRVRARLERFAADPGVLAHDQEHVVSEGPAPVWSPRAPTTPFALRCAPDGGGARFDQANDDDIRAVATALHDTVARLRGLFGDLSYNLIFATAPRDHHDVFHWWVDIVPRLGVPAGFELGTGVWVNIVAPADAAAAVRGARGIDRVKIRVGVTIGASPDAVWEIVEPVEDHVKWMADAASIAFVTEQHRGVGTQFDCLTKVGPIRLNDRMVITEWEPGRVMGIEHHGIVQGRGRFTIEGVGDASRFTWTEQLRFPAWMGGPVGEMAAKPVLEALWRRNLQTLRELVEGSCIAE